LIGPDQVVMVEVHFPLFLQETTPRDSRSLINSIGLPQVLFPLPRRPIAAGHGQSRHPQPENGDDDDRADDGDEQSGAAGLLQI
jgi:hypothetical protein